MDRNQCLEGCEGQQGVEEPPRLPLSVSDQSDGGLGWGHLGAKSPGQLAGGQALCGTCVLAASNPG